MCTKKGAPRPALWHTAGLGAPFPGYKYWHALGWRSIIRQAVSIRLMERGLAMDAGQSCIAGPSVCFPWYHLRFLSRPHLSLCASRGDQREGRSCGCLHGASPHTIGIRIVVDGNAREVWVPVKQSDQGIIRQSRLVNKPFFWCGGPRAQFFQCDIAF